LVPPDILRTTQTFRDRNPDFQYLLFNEKGAESFIEEHFTAREVAAFRACAVPAMQADYFRYCAVLALGGIYADADMRCVANLAPLVAPVGDAQFYYRPTHHIVPNGFFIAPDPGHPLLQFALEVATINIERRSIQNVRLATGPGIISALYGMHMCGSLEIYRLATAERTPKLVEPLTELLNIVQARAGGRARELLARAQFSPIEVLLAFVREEPMEYKQAKGHWLHWQGSIYR
jgi:hypothetical protein